MASNERLIWFKGNIVPLSEAKIHVLSPTSQFGANVFEGIRGYWNEDEKQLYLFRMEDHVNRLQRSIKMMRFESTYSNEFFTQSVIDVIKANEFKEDIACRQTVFVDGFGNWAATSPVEMFIAPIKKARTYSPEKKGINVCVSSWKRIDESMLSPKVKVGANYMNSRMGQIEAVNAGYDSTLFLNSYGKVSEGPGSCMFMVRDNQLITPPITASILESITRDTILKLAKDELHLEVIERDIDRTELYIADELFLCGSAVEIVPILSVDKYQVSDDIGSISKQIRELYFKVIRGKLSNYHHWLTPIY